MGAIKTLIIGLIILFFMACTSGESCENENCSYQSTPNYCKKENHTSGKVRFYLKTDSLNPKVNIKVYYGNIEEGVLVNEFELKNNDEYQSLPNGEYTFAAIYKTKSDPLVVIKTLELEPESGEETCCYTCYESATETLDLIPE